MAFGYVHYTWFDGLVESSGQKTVRSLENGGGGGGVGEYIRVLR